MCRSLLVVLPACLAALLACAGADCQPAPPEDLVVAAARQRQAAVKTLAIVFDQTEIEAKGGYSEVHSSVPPTAPLPPAELRLESTSRLLIDGDKLRYENNHPHWNNRYAADGAAQPCPCVTAFDGSGVCVFYPKGFKDGGEPLAMKSAKSEGLALMTNVPAPVMAAVRGADSVWTLWPADKMKPSGDTLVIDGTPCPEYVIDPGHMLSSDGLPIKNLTRHFWLEPARDYIIRRVETREEDRVVDRTEIHYKRASAAVWFPEKWDYHEHALSGKEVHTVTVAVRETRVNEPIATRSFDLTFPPGTLVNDTATNTNYYVQPNGSLREDDGTNGATLPDEGTSWYRNKWLLVGIAASLAAGFGLAGFRRRKRR